MGRESDLQKVAETLLDYAENRTTFQSDKIVRLPASSYTDPDVWEKEIETIFMKLPLCLASTAELRDKNAYKAMDVIGLPVLITRGRDGKVRAFLNVCSHRGAPVAENGCGIKARFACKYHGWTYSNDGKLLGITEQKTFGDVDKSELGLRELPCKEQGGLIFVCLTPGEELKLDEHLSAMLEDLESVDFADWAYLGKREITSANWKIAIDGYVEGYHFAQLHPETIHPRTISNLTYFEAFGPHLRIGFAQQDIKEKFAAAEQEKWGEMENTGYDFVRILFPNTSIFVAPEITQIAQLFPGPTPDQNTTILNFFRREGPKDDEDKAALEGMMDWLRTVVDEEDYLTVTQIQKGLESGAHDSIVLGKNERGNQYIHEWITWFVNGDESADTPTL